jgi:sulfur relay protein TusB/DsrH
MEKLYLLKNLDVNALSIAVESESSGLLLMQDATYMLNESRRESRLVRTILEKGRPIYYLGKDVERRGLNGKLVTGAQPLDYDGMVDLLFSAATVINM